MVRLGKARGPSAVATWSTISMSYICTNLIGGGRGLKIVYLDGPKSLILEYYLNSL